MLQWICPECGRECEPNERDCPVCYPQAAPAAVAQTKPAAIATRAAAEPAPVALAAPNPVKAPVVSIAPPPLPSPAAILQIAAPEIATLPAIPIPVLAPPLEPPPPAVQSTRDPVPAGLTALSQNMRVFDHRSRGGATALASDRVTPLPSGLAFDLGLGSAPVADILSNGTFQLRDGRLEPLTLPEFTTPVDLWAGFPSGDRLEIEWLAPETSGPRHAFPVPELDYDPALARLAEDHGERERELTAMDLAGLAPGLKLQPPVVVAGQAANARIVAEAPASLPWQETWIAFPDFEASAAADEQLLAEVRRFEAEQKEIRDLEAAAGKCSRLFVDPAAPQRLTPRKPGPAAPPELAFRGYTAWIQAAPMGRPVARFEMEFDASLLERVQEWEESGQAVAPPPDAPVHVQEEPSPVTASPVAVEPEAPPQQQALVTLEQALAAIPPEIEAGNRTGEALTPIVEMMAPPIARLTRLPALVLRPAGEQPGPRRTSPQAEFSDSNPLVPSTGKLVKIIPSPIMNIHSSRVTAPPGWLVTAAIALLIPITALGVVNYWILPSQRTSAASAPAAQVTPETPAPAAPATPKPTSPAPAAVNWQRHLELTGLRLQGSTVKCIAVNHGRENVPALNLLVTLRSSRASSEPPVGTFRVRLSPLAAGDSREIAEPISFVPPMRQNIDWSDLRAEIQIAK
jgi:hypothetical protein